MNTYLSTHIGELAALATAFCWTFTSMAFESAGKKVGSLSVNLIRLVMVLVLLSLYTLVTQGALLPLQAGAHARSEEHTFELQSRPHLVCRLLLEKKKKKNN